MLVRIYNRDSRTILDFTTMPNTGLQLGLWEIYGQCIVTGWIYGALCTFQSRDDSDLEELGMTKEEIEG